MAVAAFGPLTLPLWQFFDDDGHPLAGALLYTYVAGTSTPKATFLDSVGTPNTNPITLDSSGRAVIYVQSGTYKLVLNDSTGNPVWTQDNVANVGLFGLAGDVVGTTDTQALFNKTIGNTNAVSLLADRFSLVDPNDVSKALQFSAVDIGTATVRTLTAPDADTTIVGTDAIQTLTNKIIVGGSSSARNTALIYAASGAIAVASGVAVLILNGAMAMTLVAPVNGGPTDQAGTTIIITSGSPYAHVVTQTAPGFNNAFTTATFGGAIGDSLTIVAVNGIWNVIANTNVVLS